MIDINAYLGHFAFRPLRHNTAAGLLALMDRHKIDRALVASASAIAYRNSHAGNEELVAEVKGHTDRLIPCAVLNPSYAGWQDDLKTCREQFGMRGVRLYPRWQKYRLTDAACIELAHAAGEAGMLVSIPLRVEDRRQQHWLTDIPDVNQQEVADLIRACPKTRFVVMSGTAYSGSLLGKKDSGLPANYALEFCLTSALMANELRTIFQNLGEERIVFGTGMPFHSPGPALLKLEVLEASAAAKRKIGHDNAARMLGLK